MIMGAGAGPGAAAAARGVRPPGVRLRQGGGKGRAGSRGRADKQGQVPASARLWSPRCGLGGFAAAGGVQLRKRAPGAPYVTPNSRGCTEGLGVVGVGCVCLGKVLQPVLPLGKSSPDLLKRTSWRIWPRVASRCTPLRVGPHPALDLWAPADHRSFGSYGISDFCIISLISSRGPENEAESFTPFYRWVNRGPAR